MTPRKTLAVYGAKRASVRVFADAPAGLVRVQWRVAGALKTKSWPNTPAGRDEAKAWARGFAEARTAPRPQMPLTLRELWERYATANLGRLRPNTQRLYLDAWRTWETMWGAGFPADEATLEMVDTLRLALTKQGRAVTSIGQVIKTAKLVHKWGRLRKLLKHNDLADYRYQLGKDQRPKSPDEYTGAEYEAMLAVLEKRAWRPFVAFTICGEQGARQNAVLHLKWSDIDLLERAIIWRAEHDKLGREWRSPMRYRTQVALAHALDKAVTEGYTGPWVFPKGSEKGKGETYTAQSLWAALRSAEKAAGVVHRKGRAAHGLRRMLAGDVAASTNDPALALQAIGDTDMRMASRYLKPRDERLIAAFDDMDQARSAAEGSSVNRNATATDSETADEGPVQLND
jgi:integrase